MATALALLSLTAALPLAAAQMPTPAQCCGTAGPGPACPGGSASGAGRFCGNGPTGKNILFLAAVRSCPLPASRLRRRGCSRSTPPAAAQDDMRPEISPYGHKYMHTPNMQSLADDGYTMRRMYVQMALCSPSRTAMLTGRRPDRSHVWNIGPYFRDTVGKDWVTMPQHFKENKGYIAAGAGSASAHFLQR